MAVGDLADEQADALYALISVAEAKLAAAGDALETVRKSESTLGDVPRAAGLHHRFPSATTVTAAIASALRSYVYRTLPRQRCSGNMNANAGASPCSTLEASRRSPLSATSRMK